MLAFIALSILIPVDSLVFKMLLPLSDSSLGTLWAHTADLLGNGLLLYPAALVALLFLPTRASRRKGFREAVALFALAGLAGQVFKFLIGRPRPGMGLEAWDLNAFSLSSDFHSFPSGHTVTAFSVALVLCYYFPRYRSWWIGLALFISIGRLVGQSHFLTDIAAGILISCFAAELVFVHDIQGFLHSASSKGGELKADNV